MKTFNYCDDHVIFDSFHFSRIYVCHCCIFLIIVIDHIWCTSYCATMMAHLDYLLGVANVTSSYICSQVFICIVISCIEANCCMFVR